MSLQCINSSKVIVRFATRVFATKPASKIVEDQDKDRKCDPREEPRPRKYELGKAVGKWIRKYITGAAEPIPPPPPDPRPVCTPCLLLGADPPLPPFPKLHCVFEGVMEHAGNNPPLKGERVFLMRQSVSFWKDPFDREIAMLNYIESEEHIRDFHDPIAKFTSVGEHMIELVDKRLHPYYNKYRKLTPMDCHMTDKYHTKGPVVTPIRIRYNEKQLDKKNLYVDMKRFDPPPQEYSTQTLDLKVNEKAMLDAQKKATIKEMLKKARRLIKEHEDSQPTFRTIGN